MLGHIQINSTKPRVQYVGDGTKHQFFFPFPIFLAANLEVYLGSVRQVSGFVVNGVGESDGGSVTFAAPPAAGVLVTLRRQLTIHRMSDFQDSGQFRAKVLNDELDHVTATLQQLDAEVARSIRLSPTDSDTSLTLPEAARRAGHTIVFDEQGNLTTRPADAAATSGAWTNLDDVPEGILHRHFTISEQNKLSAIEPGAETNPAPVSETEKAEATETALRSFSPRDIHDIASRSSGSGAVASVYGRTGAVVAAAGDYTADQITETATRKFMTTSEREKLDGIEPGARARPPVVSAHEKSAATLTEIRSFSPKDIADIAAAIGSFSGSTGQVDGGLAASIFNSFIDGGLASA